MAHEISINVLTGKAEAAFMRPAWHNLGQIVPEGVIATSDVMRNLAGLGYNVSKRCITGDGGIDGGDKRMTVRDDTNTMLGIVDKGYGVVQNWEAFDFCDSLRQDGIIIYESAMALRGGAVVVLLCRMPSTGTRDEVIPGDNQYRYLMFQTSHDGSLKLHVRGTSVRVVCANTLRLALAKGAQSDQLEGIRHIGDMSKKLAAVKMIVSQYDAAFDLHIQNARKLASVRVPSSEVEAQYLDTLVPPVKVIPGKASRAATLRNARVDEIKSNFRNPRNTLKGMGESWWAMANAASETIDHGESVTFKGEGTERLENKFLNVIGGKDDAPGIAFKAKAFNLAMQFAGVS